MLHHFVDFPSQDLHVRPEFPNVFTDRGDLYQIDCQTCQDRDEGQADSQVKLSVRKHAFYFPPRIANASFKEEALPEAYRASIRSGEGMIGEPTGTFVGINVEYEPVGATGKPLSLVDFFEVFDSMFQFRFGESVFDGLRKLPEEHGVWLIEWHI